MDGGLDITGSFSGGGDEVISSQYLILALFILVPRSPIDRAEDVQEVNYRIMGLLD